MLKIGKAQDQKLIIVYNDTGEEIQGVYQYEPRSRLVKLMPYWYKGVRYDWGLWRKEDLSWKYPGIV